MLLKRIGISTVGDVEEMQKLSSYGLICRELNSVLLRNRKAVKSVITLLEPLSLCIDPADDRPDSRPFPCGFVSPKHSVPY